MLLFMYGSENCFGIYLVTTLVDYYLLISITCRVNKINITFFSIKIDQQVFPSRKTRFTKKMCRTYLKKIKEQHISIFIN